MHTIRLTISLRWWFRLYLYGLITAAYLSGRTPDPAKVQRVVSRAVVVRFKTVRFGVLA